jgi:hypothetical protein
MDIIQTFRDMKLWGRWFKDQWDTWTAWFACLAAIFALKPTPGQLEIYQKHTGRKEWPKEQAREGWICVGRRGGKSIVSAICVLFIACFRNHSKFLAPGEVGTVAIIAADRRQARTILRYVNGFIDLIPMLRAMVTNRTADSISFNNDTVIEIHTCSFRSPRGYRLIAVVGDEIAFWMNTENSSNPDREIIAAVRPGLATTPGALLLCISSPYAKRGMLWEMHRKHYGKDDDPVLVWQATTRDMNPTVPQEIIDQAMEEDPDAARAEYLAEFRSDIEAFVSRDIIDSLVIPGRQGLPPVRGIQYVAFIDPSGGSADSMTLAIAHEKDGLITVDCILEKRPPFSPEGVAREFADTLNEYRVSEMTGDRYGGEWPREQFRRFGISYKLADKTKSELYQAMLPTLNSGQVELPENKRLIHQLCNLERRTARGGRDSIDHSQGQHDDLANAVAGAIAECGREKYTITAKKLSGF